MSNEQVISFGIPLVLFEYFLQSGYGELDIEYDNDYFNITLNSDILNDYYNTFYISQISNESLVNDENFHIPIFVDKEKKEVLSILEAKKNGAISNLNSNIAYFQFEEGEEKTEILEFSREYLENSIMDQAGFSINTSFGSVYFSVDYITIVLSKKEFQNFENFPFLIREDSSIFGVLVEANLEEGNSVELIKI